MKSILKRLSAAERKHLRESTNRVSLAALRRNREAQKAGGFECQECRMIALKLGIEK